MSWTYSFTEQALKQLRKLDRTTQRRILNWLDARVLGADNPKQWGKELKGDFTGLWRYRVGDYRVVCQLKKDDLIVLVIRVRHRKDKYH